MPDQFEPNTSIRQLAQQARELSPRIFETLRGDVKSEGDKVSEQDLLSLDMAAAALAALAAQLRYARLGDEPDTRRPFLRSI